jgi:FMN phosphatase YigB (HAD superfamily)
MTETKVIVTDADGVCLNWEWAFEVWMEEHGHKLQPDHAASYDMGLRYGISKEDTRKLIKIFNESAAIGFLPALRDATYYIKMLHEKHGYVFDVVTSLSTNPYAQKLRKKNMRKLFGDTAFRKFKFLATGADKDAALLPYKDSGLFWIEDRTENAELGHRLGMKSLLMAHGHNYTYAHDDIRVVKDWSEIYEIVLASEK